MMALGSLVAYLTVGPLESLGASFALASLGSFLVLLAVVFVVFPIEERWFWPHAARASHDPGLEVHIERVEYHLFYHAALASTEGRALQVTIAGLPGRVRRAVALAAGLTGPGR